MIEVCQEGYILKSGKRGAAEWLVLSRETRGRDAMTAVELEEGGDALPVR